MLLAGVAMLVVTANWSFADGSLVSARRRSRAARRWLRAVRLAAVRNGFGRDGRYRPVTALDVVLAGDTFDGLVSAAWCGRERPWRAGGRAAETRRRVMLGCARHAAPLIAGLARLTRSGLQVPAADSRGRPSAMADVPIPVRCVVLAGDRDGTLAELANDVAVRGVVLAPAWSDGAVVVAHGHEHDPACHATDVPPGAERPPTLGESVAIELVAPFAIGLDAAGLPRGVTGPLVAALADASTAELPAVVAGWITAEGRRAAVDGTTLRAIDTAWQRAVEAWQRAARRDPPDCGLPASPVEALADWFAGTGEGSPRGLADLFDPPPPAAIRAAADERVMVMGHAGRMPGDGKAICLGHSAVRRWRATAIVRADCAAEASCVDAALAAMEPATVAFRSSGASSEWHWIAGVRGTVPEVDQRPAPVVDAA